MKSRFFLYGATLCAAIPLFANLRATPATMPDLPDSAAIWVPGNAVGATNMEMHETADSYSGTILYYLAPQPEQGEFFARYDFEAPAAGEYRFYAAITHQGVDYTSPTQFRFDSGAWENFETIQGSRSSWGVSNAINWENLGVRSLKPGKHTLEFRIVAKAPNQNWSFMCDGIYAVNLSEAAGMQISDLQLAESESATELQVSFQYQGKSKAFPVEARLLFCDQAVTSKVLMPQQGHNQLTLSLPPHLGNAAYTVTLTPVDTPEARLAERLYRPANAAAQSVSQPNQVFKAEIDGTTLKADFVQPFAVDGKLSVALFFDRVLYGVQNIPVPAQTASVEAELSEDLKALAAGREVELALYPSQGDGAQQIRSWSQPGPTAELPLPMNYGVFIDRDQTAHFWYMDHDSRYLFDGSAYLPIGGMWCPETLLHQTTDPVEIQRHLERDRKTLDELAKYGINDVYLNMSSPAPRWVAQFLIDELERRGIEYGYQGGVGASDIPAFFITRENSQPGWQQPLKAEYRDGMVIAKVPKSYKVNGFLILPDDGQPQWCRYVNFTDTEGANTRHHIIDLETVQDFDDLRQVQFPLELPGKPENLVLIPQLQAGMHHVNLWDPEVMTRTLELQRWYSQMQWGPNFRFIVDPINNETSMLNATENLRQYTEPINAVFAEWLTEKYGDLPTLQAAWAIPVDSWATASRLVPLRIVDTLILADPESGSVFTAAPEDSAAWLDYNTMIRETYARLADEVAVFIKTQVDVPVIYKSVGVIGERMNVSNQYQGCDGIGFEIYLNGGIPGETGGGASKAEAELSSHTMWKVGTEIGHSFAVGNDGTKFFKNEAELRGVTQDLLDLGVQGFYFFGLDLKPEGLWDNHNYHDFPDGLSWVQRIAQDINSGVLAPVPERRLYLFPGGYTYWWWANRHTVVHNSEISDFMRSARRASQPREWYVSTNVPPERFDEVVVNCPRPPFSRYHAREIAQLLDTAESSGGKVIFLGEREDLGAIPVIDAYYTQERIQLPDGATAQVLNPGGATILAEEQGKPWAIRQGALTIISRHGDTLDILDEVK